MSQTVRDSMADVGENLANEADRCFGNHEHQAAAIYSVGSSLMLVLAHINTTLEEIRDELRGEKD